MRVRAAVFALVVASAGAALAINACSDDSSGGGGVSAEGGGGDASAGDGSSGNDGATGDASTLACGAAADGWVGEISLAGAPPGITALTEPHWTGSDLVFLGLTPSTLSTPERFVLARYDLATSKWSELAMTGVPEPWHARSVIAGTKLMVWGGTMLKSVNPYDALVDTGYVLDLVSGAWTPMGKNGPSPLPRTSHTLAWTGTRLIVWNGIDDLRYPTFADDSGGIYDPATGTWTAIPSASGVANTSLQTGVWTGTHLVAMGGGRAYEVEKGVWTPCPGVGALSILTAGFDGGALGVGPTSAGVTATRLLSCAGDAGCTSDGDAGAAPPARTLASLTLANTKVVYFGGKDAKGKELADSIAFDLTSRRWDVFSKGAVGRTGHFALWTGDRLVVWGGSTKGPVGCILAPTP